MATENQAGQGDGKPVSLILGATGGQGRALAQRLGDSGHRLALAGRDLDELNKLAEPYDALTVKVEGTQIDSIVDAFEQTAAHFGRVDAAANCIGSILLAPAHRTSSDQWYETLNINLTSAFATVKGAANTMNSGGSVVLFSTAAARVGLANHEAIAAAKAGVIGLMQSAAATYASRGLRFNAVAPGLVRSKMSERLFANEQSRKLSEAMHPLHRLGEPSDTVPILHWLMQEESSWVTGQVFGIDGGLSTLRPSR